MSVNTMVHEYKNNGFNIVLDVNSGAVHITDDIVYDLIPLMEQDIDASDEVLFERLNGKYKAEDIKIIKNVEEDENLNVENPGGSRGDKGA